MDATRWILETKAILIIIDTQEWKHWKCIVYYIFLKWCKRKCKKREKLKHMKQFLCLFVSLIHTHTQWHTHAHTHTHTHSDTHCHTHAHTHTHTHTQTHTSKRQLFHKAKFNGSLFRPDPGSKDHFEIFGNELQVTLDDQLISGHLVQSGWWLADTEPGDGLVASWDTLAVFKHLHIADVGCLVACVEGG